ncbi:unnamed protein product [Paramecium sonneborni]|uniref:Protein kinase domain-containing protein n=1 Tax=Paramecium sonneborni TaxID=65129 RepID=A0A8S1LPY9_9CILI|nr:unnamed protein product [Paramecium sonneborni]
MANSEQSQKVQNYILDRTLGRGTFGKVRLGYHTICKEYVAVKILQKNKIENNADLDRVQREISILRKVNHENIIKLYEILESDQNLYLVMEYAKGGELFDYIVKKHQLSELIAARLFIQLINAVEYLHSLNISHRDLKPENLLLDEQRNLKVADFGLSNLYKTNESLKTACGSPCYAAPEMLYGKPYFGDKSDIWSCGIILYVMLSGYLPFEHENTKLLYEMIKYQDYEQPKNISSIAKDLLRKLLTKDPQLRIGFDEIKQHQFYKLVIIQPEQIITNKDTIVFKMLLELGYDINTIYDQVKDNKHNSNTTLFWLFRKKVCNQNFINQVLGQQKCNMQQQVQVLKKQNLNLKNQLQQSIISNQINQSQNHTARSNSKGKLNQSIQQRCQINNYKINLDDLNKYTDRPTGIQINFNKIRNYPTKVQDSLKDSIRQKAQSVQDRNYNQFTPDFYDLLIKQQKINNNPSIQRRKSATEQIERFNFAPNQQDKIKTQIQRGRNRTISQNRKNNLTQRYSKNYTPFLNHQNTPEFKLNIKPKNQLNKTINQSYQDQGNTIIPEYSIFTKQFL